MDEYLITLRTGQKIRGEIIEVHFDVGVAKLRVMAPDIDLIEKCDAPEPDYLWPNIILLVTFVAVVLFIWSFFR